MNNKKKKILTLATFSLLASMTWVYAGPLFPTSSDTGSSSTDEAIQALGNRIDALAKANVRLGTYVAHELDKSFLSALEMLNKQDDIQTKNRDLIHQESNNLVKQSLSPFAYKTLTYTNKNQPEVKLLSGENEKNDSAQRLLRNVEGSDSIISLVQGIDASTFWTRKNLSAPERNDAAFNFSNLVEPEAYTEEQDKNSKNFIAIATKQYKSYTDGVNLDQLRDAFNNYKARSPKVLGQKIIEFRNNTTYSNYQMNIRSIVANKSLANDILMGIAAERRPIRTMSPDPQLDAISRAIGVVPRTIEIPDPDNEGQKITVYTYASQQQIAKYQVNHDKQWYQEVATDSLENLQRKSLLLQDQISKQLLRNHLDNEKIMAALALSLMQNNEAAEPMMKLQVNDVNSAIKSFYDGSVNTDSSSSNTVSNDSSSNNDYSKDNAQNTYNNNSSNIPDKYKN